MSAALMGGCSLVNPHVGPPPAIEESIRNTPTLANAQAYSAALRKEWREAIGDQATLNSLSGLALIPVGLTAAYLGVQGGSSEAILGLGLGGSGIYLGSSFLRSRPRQDVYAEGLRGLTCIDVAMRPLKSASASASGLNTVQRQLQAAVINLELTIRTQGANHTGKDLDRAQLALAQGKAALAQGAQLSAQLEQAGSIMIEGIDQVRDVVTRALIQTEPDFRQLASSLGSAIPLTVAQPPSTAQPPSPAPKPGLLFGQRRQNDINRRGLTDPTDAVVHLTAELMGIVGRAQAAAPSREELAQCGVALRTLLPPVSLGPEPAPAPAPAAAAASAAASVQAAAAPRPDSKVSALQQGLTSLGLFAGPVDGILGPKTRTAAAAFVKVSEAELQKSGLLTTRIDELIAAVNEAKPPVSMNGEGQASATACAGVTFDDNKANCELGVANEDEADRVLLPQLVERKCAQPATGNNPFVIKAAVNAGLAKLVAQCKLPSGKGFTEYFCRIKNDSGKELTCK